MYAWRVCFTACHTHVCVCGCFNILCVLQGRHVKTGQLAAIKVMEVTEVWKQLRHFHLLCFKYISFLLCFWCVWPTGHQAVVVNENLLSINWLKICWIHRWSEKTPVHFLLLNETECATVLHSGHLSDTFNQSDLQWLIHTLTHLRAESTMQGDRQLVRSSQGEASCSGAPQHSARRSRGGIELASFHLHLHLLYLLC